MPARTWDGYGRFCPLARALDVIGERWTIVIAHQLLAGPARYSELRDDLPGIGSNVLADRLRKLEAAGVVERVPGAVGEGTRYRLTERGSALGPAMAELRRWGADELIDPDGGERTYDHFHAIPAELDLDQTYQWLIDDDSLTLRIRDRQLTVSRGEPRRPDAVVRTSRPFLRRWAAGETNWDAGIADGEVSVEVDATTWDAMLVATNYPGRAPGLADRLIAASSSIPGGKPRRTGEA